MEIITSAQSGAKANASSRVPAVDLARARAYVGTTCLIVGSLALGWYARHILLLGFAAILNGVVLHRMAAWLSARTRLRYPLGLFAVVFTLAAVTAGAILLLAPDVSDQIDGLSDRLPKALSEARGHLESIPWAKRLLSSTLSSQQSGRAAIVALPSIVWSISEILGAFLFIAFGGLFLASQPALYVEGFLRMLPPPRRAEGRRCLTRIGGHLSNWMLAQLILMLTVGSLTVVGLWVLKMPMALSLGLLTGVLIFIPYTGSVVSAVPAIGLALLENASKAVWVAVVYLAAHNVEAYIVGPVLQRKVVNLPPALNLGFQVLMGLLAGIPGIALASPLLLVLWALVETLYLEKSLQHG